MGEANRNDDVQIARATSLPSNIVRRADLRLLWCLSKHRREEQPESQSHLVRSRSMVLLWSFWRPAANSVLQTSLDLRTRVANQKGEDIFQSVQKEKIFGVSRVCIVEKKKKNPRVTAVWPSRNGPKGFSVFV